MNYIFGKKKKHFFPKKSSIFVKKPVSNIKFLLCVHDKHWIYEQIKTKKKYRSTIIKGNITDFVPILAGFY